MRNILARLERLERRQQPAAEPAAADDIREAVLAILDAEHRANQYDHSDNPAYHAIVAQLERIRRTQDDRQHDF